MNKTLELNDQELSFIEDTLETKLAKEELSNTSKRIIINILQKIHDTNDR